MYVFGDPSWWKKSILVKGSAERVRFGGWRDRWEMGGGGGLQSFEYTIEI